MSIKSICKTNVMTIEKSATLKQVSNLMRKQHVGAIVVTEGLNGKKSPVGIITDRDLALALDVAPVPQDLVVEHMMLYRPIMLKTSTDILDATKIMRDNGVKRLPVTNDDGSLYGIVTADDILVLLGDEMKNLSQITDIQIKKEQGERTPAERHV